MAALLTCPNCGHDEYYVHARLTGWTQINYRLDGKEGADNSHIHDSLDYAERKTRFCGQCHKNLGTKPKESTT